MKIGRNIYSDESLKEIWDSAPSAIDAALATRMKRAVDKEISGSPAPRSRTWKFVPVAVCSMLILLSVGFGLVFHSRQAGSRQLTQIVTEKGQKDSLVLEDGTKVWLNCDSELSFASFAKTRSRDIYLKGECYFEVAKDPRKPFVVHTDVYDVTAVGTSFNVRAYPYDSTVKTTLVEGKVLVDGNDFHTSLLPSESLTYNRNRKKFDKSRNECACYDGLWKGNELYVEKGTTLYELSKILERNYNFEFKFKDEALKEYTFEGVIKNCQLTTALDLISLSAPIKYQIQGNQVVFSHK